ncbi:hypothetical protein GE115_14430 [Agromyces sp. CFH 90414]|uniref:histidine kinase n=1 Tax=Agromyces agglutinans TaxID=2662258 RepID=A0A6I2FEC7_9MICO|nr:histidine kinase [Agromyces agglutinans]MRG61050.1 hypothetical protein [Agromyces agglutinans]
MSDASPEPGRPVRRAPSVADWVWAGALAAGLLPLTIVELLRSVPGRDLAAWVGGVLLCFLVLHLTVVLRKVRPRGAVAVASAAMLGLVALSLPFAPTVAVLLPSSAVYLVLVYSVAASDDRVAAIAAPAIGLAGAGLMTWVAAVHESDARSGFAAPPGALIALAGFLVASIGAAWALGRYRRESLRKRAAQALAREQAVELGRQRERAVIAEERQRIGRDLHDVVAHSLAVVVAQAEAARVLLDLDPVRARAAVEHVIGTGRGAMADMRGLLSTLGDASASAGTAADALRPTPGIADLRELVERVRGPERAVMLVEVGEGSSASPGLGLTIYRVAQESLTNTLKHAPAPTRSELRLEWGRESVVLTIDDDGRSVEASDTASGRGIRGMSDRVAQVGGRLETGRRPDGEGWRVRAVLPILTGGPAGADGPT